MAVRILVVDDEDSVLDFLKRLLEREGHEVHVAADGEEAARRVTAERFDLLVVDKNLPGMNGLQFIASARLTQPDVPAILITAYPEPLLAPGVKLQGYLAKPFESLAKITDAVTRALWLKSLQDRSPSPAPHVTRRP